MEAVAGNRSHRPGSSLGNVGPSQLMWAENGDDQVATDTIRIFA